MKYYLFSILHFILIYIIFQSLRLIFPSIVPSCCGCIIVWVLLVYMLSFGFTKKKFLDDKIDPSKKAVLITGCDTGFGHNLAKRLDSKGYHVFAGCLFPTGPDAKILIESCSQRLKVLGIDVTKDDSVEKAVEFVKTNLGFCDLWAVVNNAGILKGFSVELTELEEFQETMEVNAFGPVRVTKAFLPLLKQTKGRVVTVTSLAGRVTLPYSTPYCMSKYAAVAFSDCLRQELDEYGVRVISIEPEMFKTNMTKKENIEEKLNYTCNTAKITESKERVEIFKSLKNLSDSFLYFLSSKIELVVNNMECAVTAKYPELIYKPRRNILFRFLCQSYEVIPVYFQYLVAKIVLDIFKLFC